ncbi:MAG: ankyrin repeat domain-containing protein [Bacteroidetes bacterium]|nr:MAG: ankyrin repeat domain-containing protein [Bacteroidota bacterium]
MNGGDWKEMFEASQNGNLPLVKYHLKMGVDVNYQHPEILCTALNVSIENGHTHIASYLLENGADPHIKAIFEGLDAMQTAELYKRKDIIDILKKSGKYL